MLINAFPQALGQVIGSKVELCRFTQSGTFDPQQYPTTDGLYDVYIVGGGGGSRKYMLYNDSKCSGGGGGYAKLLKNLKLSSRVAVTIGSSGNNGYERESGSSLSSVASTNGGTTKFGNYGSANGGEAAETSSRGGNGGCGGAAVGGNLGGLDGNDGSYGTVPGTSLSGNDSITGEPGKGGGNKDFCPTNPYDGQHYGIGGNAVITAPKVPITSWFQPLNNNAGRGGTGYNEALPLPGICIIYGIPLKQ